MEVVISRCCGISPEAACAEALAALERRFADTAWTTVRRKSGHRRKRPAYLRAWALAFGAQKSYLGSGKARGVYLCIFHITSIPRLLSSA
jgi:hypothetical protein